MNTMYYFRANHSSMGDTCVSFSKSKKLYKMTVDYSTKTESYYFSQGFMFLRKVTTFKDKETPMIVSSVEDLPFEKEVIKKNFIAYDLKRSESMVKAWERRRRKQIVHGTDFSAEEAAL